MQGLGGSFHATLRSLLVCSTGTFGSLPARVSSSSLAPLADALEALAGGEEDDEDHDEDDHGEDELHLEGLPPHLAAQVAAAVEEGVGLVAQVVGLVDEQLQLLAAAEHLLDVVHHDGLHLGDLLLHAAHLVELLRMLLRELQVRADARAELLLQRVRDGLARRGAARGLKVLLQALQDREGHLPPKGLIRHRQVGEARRRLHEVEGVPITRVREARVPRPLPRRQLLQALHGHSAEVAREGRVVAKHRRAPRHESVDQRHREPFLRSERKL
mmetsp:Transcript_13599/g.49448  ORF Transcript_13599/g.49448 Transcript_13599/m.49448 type:complete len:272 (-) Transcript_13599:219-1034(-)